MVELVRRASVWVPLLVAIVLLPGAIVYGSDRAWFSIVGLIVLQVVAVIVRRRTPSQQTGAADNHGR